MADRAVGYFATFAFGALLAMSIPAHPQPSTVCRNPYAIAQSLGCDEVGRECRLHAKQERIFHGR